MLPWELKIKHWPYSWLNSRSFTDFKHNLDTNIISHYWQYPFHEPTRAWSLPSLHFFPLRGLFHFNVNIIRKPQLFDLTMVLSKFKKSDCVLSIATWKVVQEEIILAINYRMCSKIEIQITSAALELLSEKHYFGSSVNHHLMAQMTSWGRGVCSVLNILGTFGYFWNLNKN